ncbi:hypothetical protein [Roseateles sp.]|uniref:hypothetical protein n=1 Tax=Roseateles sp. TaxID=1971397 RepID=UPI002E012F8B|nr:hypothetical protein [Roseateles sp.]
MAPHRTQQEDRRVAPAVQQQAAHPLQPQPSELGLFLRARLAVGPALEQRLDGRIGRHLSHVHAHVHRVAIVQAGEAQQVEQVRPRADEAGAGEAAGDALETGAT